MQSFTIDGIVVMPPLVAEYRLDPTIESISELITYEQGHSFEYFNFLKDVNDLSINKSSVFFLSKPNRLTDYFNIKDIPFEYPINLTSFMAFNSLTADPMSGLSALSGACLTSVTATTAVESLTGISDTQTSYVTIQPNIIDTENVLTRSISAETFLQDRIDKSLPQRYYFNIMIIDALNCYIYHLDGEDRWYLTHKDGLEDTFEFTKISHPEGLENITDQIDEDGGDKIKFQYLLDRKSFHIRIYKQFNGSTHVLRLLTDEERQITPLAVPIRLEDTLDPDNDTDNSTGAPNVLELTNNTTMKIRPPLRRQLTNSIDSKIYDYDHSLNGNTLTTSKGSKLPLVNSNLIIHSEYYYLTGESLPINFFNLKNSSTPDGITTPSNIDPRQNLHNHRDYSKIYTGSNQLEGSSQISMEYAYGEAPIDIKPGMNYFNAPQNLSPYTKLNINDTTLIECGAVAGSNPAQSDKMYKKRSGSERYNTVTRWGPGSTNEENYGTWLCTWLSGGDDPTQKPVWMDRYYNPQSVGYIDALTETKSYSHNEYNSKELEENFSVNKPEVFDIKSKLTFEPGGFYAYYRINGIDVKNCLSVLDPFHIQKDFSKFNTITNKPVDPVNGAYDFNGKEIAATNCKSTTVDLPGLAVNFDVNLKNYKTVYNHQILGNYTTDGVGFFNRNDVSPFVYVLAADGKSIGGQRQDTSVRIYDNEYKMYNYVTNDSFLDDDEVPGFFQRLIIRELPENIYAVMSTGVILEMSHDGVVVSSYNAWSSVAESLITEDGFTPIVSDSCYDERFIYILTHTGTKIKSYKVHVFDTWSKSFEEYTDSDCIFHVPVPREFVKNNKNYGSYINPKSPPNLITIKLGNKRRYGYKTIYLAHGNQLKTSKNYLWVHVTGAADEVSQLQTKHDTIYIFDTLKLRLLKGQLTDNNLFDSTIPLSIIDYVIDDMENIWLAHSTNLISKYSSSRQLLLTKQLTEQQIISMVVTRDFTDTGVVSDTLVVLGNTSGEETIEFQIGPTNHPTNDQSSPDWRKASPWILDGNRYDRSRFIDEDSLIYDDLSGFDDTQEIIYPFMDGSNRFGEQSIEIGLLSTDDPAGRVLDGDYEIITEGFDYFVTETNDDLKGTLFDIKSGNIIGTKDIDNLSVEDLTRLPQLVNHFEYTMLNFNRYSKNNLNCKLSLKPLFKAIDPLYINFKVNLDSLTTQPYTDYVNITLNLNNIEGYVELLVNGRLYPNCKEYFEPNKYRFSTILNRDLIAGATPYLNDTLLCDKLNSQSKYLVKDVSIKNLGIYNKHLEYYEIINLLRRENDISPMYWSLPTDRRNYIETIDRVFNHSIPPRKSNVFDLVVRNSSIRSLPLQTYISGKLQQLLPKIIPAGTKVRNISWSNELFDFTQPGANEIDYNPVADEIIVDPSGITLPAYLPYILQ